MQNAYPPTPQQELYDCGVIFECTVLQSSLILTYSGNAVYDRLRLRASAKLVIDLLIFYQR